MSLTTKPKLKSVGELRKWLQPTEYLSPGNEYMKHLNLYVPGTGDWLRESEVFRKWEDGVGTGCLWVRGVPGSGKSVFAASTVKTLAETQDAEGRQAPVLFFFFRQIVEKNHDPKYLVRDWTAQLLPFSTNLQEQLDELSNLNINGIETTMLWDALVKSLEGMRMVYCVADALDEMDDQHARFIDNLRQLGDHMPARIKVMLTSRPIPRIENQLRHPSVESVRLEPAHIHPDIVSYVSTRLGSLEPRLSRSKELLVNDAICERSEGLFLYARLSMDSLTEGLQQGGIIEDTLPTSLAELPRNLTELYTRLLEEHSKRTGITQAQQFTLLQCVTQSSRPLRLIELGSIVALLMRDVGASLKEGKELVRQACGRCLEILEDESVSVIHHSFTEFLRDTSRSPQPGSFPVMNEREAQRIMVQVCLQYLDSCAIPNCIDKSTAWPVESEDYDSGAEFAESRANEIKERELLTLRSSYPFLAYASQNLEYHVRRAEAGNSLHALLDLFFVPGKAAFELWLLVNWPHHRRGDVQTLHVAAYLGLTEYVRYLVTGYSLSAIDAQDPEGMTALSYAVDGDAYGDADVKKDDPEIASILLANGANPDIDDRNGYKPLHLAVRRGHAKIVKLLLAAGVSPNTKKTKCTPWMMQNYGDDTGKTALQFAWEGGKPEILCQFLECLEEDDACRSLHWAARSGNTDAVEAILQTSKAPVDVLVAGISALYIAAGSMEPALIDVLLRHGADPNLRVERGEWDYYDELPEPEIKLKGEVEDGPTPLHALAGIQQTAGRGLKRNREKGLKCMKLLVDAGGNVNARTTDDHTPLHFAVQKRCSSPWDPWEFHGETTEEIMTDLFLQYGADPNARCKHGVTPLHKVGPGQPKVIDILIRNGADINTRSNDLSTPLLFFVANFSRFDGSSSSVASKEKTLFQLLEYGADVTVENDQGQTVLHYMFAQIDHFPNEAIWKAFIRAGVDLNRPNKKGEPPLLSLRQGWDSKDHSQMKDILKMLVEEGLDLNVTDSLGDTVLFKLFDDSNLKWESIECLLNLGCSINTRGQKGTTVLHLFIRKTRSMDIFPRLIQAGANPHLRDNQGNSIFHEMALAHPGSGCVSKVKTIVDLGLSTESQNEAGRTALHFACATDIGFDENGRTYGHTQKDEFLDLLLNDVTCPAGNPNSPDNLGATPLHYAAGFSEAYVGQLLRAGADPTLRTNEGLTPLHIATRGRQCNVVGLLISEYRKNDVLHTIIDAKDARSRTALHYACRSGRPESVSYLLSAGADWSSLDVDGRTPLHALAELGEENLLWGSSQATDLRFAWVTMEGLSRPNCWSGVEPNSSDSVRTKDILETLEAAGANLYETLVVDGDVCTLMDLFVRFNTIELVNLLCDRGFVAQDAIAEALIARSARIEGSKTLRARHDPPANGQVHSYDRNRPSNSEVQNFREILQQRDYTLFREFVKQGGDLTARESGEYNTGLHTLVQWGLTGLLEIYSSEAIKMDQNELMQEEEIQRTLLCHACMQPLPRLDIIKVLVEKIKVDVNKIGYHPGFTALHILSHGNHFWVVEAMEYLLDSGADIEARDGEGKTPLMGALGSQAFWNRETVRVLLDHGADTEALDNAGNSSLNMTDDVAIIRMLIARGAGMKGGKSLSLASTLPKMNVDAARVLLEAGADPNNGYPLTLAARPNDQYGLLDPFRSQRQREMVMLLLEYEANPFAYLEDGSSAIQKMIEEHGILDPIWNLPNFPTELQGKGERTPLISACFPTITPAPRDWGDNEKSECNPSAALTLLDMGANIIATDELGRTALHWMCTLSEALDEKHRFLLAQLVGRAPENVHQKDIEGFTPLQIAFANSPTQEWMIDYLIDHGCDPKIPDPSGNTILHYLAPQLVGMEKEALSAPERFGKFLAIGVPINHRNNLGETSLSRFISASIKSWDDTLHSKALEIFLSAGADIHTRNHLGETLLHIIAGKNTEVRDWAKARDWNTEKILSDNMLITFKCLMELGVDARAEDAQCRTAIDVAVACGNTFLIDLFGPKKDGMMKEIVVDDTEDEDESETIDMEALVDDL